MVGAVRAYRARHTIVSNSKSPSAPNYLSVARKASWQINVCARTRGSGVLAARLKRLSGNAKGLAERSKSSFPSRREDKPVLMGPRLWGKKRNPREKYDARVAILRSARPAHPSYLPVRLPPNLETLIFPRQQQCNPTSFSRHLTHFGARSGEDGLGVARNVHTNGWMLSGVPIGKSLVLHSEPPHSAIAGSLGRHVLAMRWVEYKRSS